MGSQFTLTDESSPSRGGLHMLSPIDELEELDEESKVEHTEIGLLTDIAGYVLHPNNRIDKLTNQKLIETYGKLDDRTSFKMATDISHEERGNKAKPHPIQEQH